MDNRVVSQLIKDFIYVYGEIIVRGITFFKLIHFSLITFVNLSTIALKYTYNLYQNV